MGDFYCEEFTGNEMCSSPNYQSFLNSAKIQSTQQDMEKFGAIKIMQGRIVQAETVTSDDDV